VDDMTYDFHDGLVADTAHVDLKQFIRVNQGRLDVFSHDGHARIDRSGETYQTLPNPTKPCKGG